MKSSLQSPKGVHILGTEGEPSPLQPIGPKLIWPISVHLQDGRLSAHEACP